MEGLLLKYVGLWSTFRRTELDRFVDEHARLYADAERTGDHGAVTAAYYAVMTELIERSYGPNWHFCPPQHPGQPMAEAISAGHERLSARLPLADGHTLLDVGSGAGGFMRYLAKRKAAEFVGVSIGKEEVVTANRLHAAAGLADRCRTLCADARTLPFADSTFDAASSIYALKYFSDLRPVFREVSRVLKPGALFLSYNIVVSDAIDRHDPRHADPIRLFEYSTGMPRLPTASEMIDAAEQSGMACVESTELTGTAPWYHYFEANPVLPLLLGSKATNTVVRAFETMRVLPKGCARFQETFVDGTVMSLLRAGRSGALNGSNILVFEKR